MKQRAKQVAEELRKIISMILIEDLTDPKMGFVTITRIELTDDLRFARVYYSVLGAEEEKQSAAESFEENGRFIRKLAVQRVNLKFAPEIRFELDHSIEHGFKIDEVLKKIKKKE